MEDAIDNFDAPNPQNLQPSPHPSKFPAQKSMSVRKPSLDSHYDQNVLNSIVKKELRGFVEQVKEKKRSGETIFETIFRLMTEKCVQQQDFDQYRLKNVTPEKFVELENSVRRLINTVDSNTSLVVSTEKQHRDLEFEVDMIRDKLTKKADLKITDRLDDKFMNYTPISKFVSLNNDIKNYAEKDRVIEIEKNIELIKNNIGLRATSADVQADFGKLKSEIDKTIARLVTKKDLEYDMNRQDVKLQKSIKRVRDEIKNLKELEGRITLFTQKLGSYPTFAVMNKKLKEIWDNFRKCCNIDHINSFKEEMEPKMASCENLVADFNLELIKNKEIIRRFDEVLLEKASKFSIDQIYTKLQDYTPITKTEETAMTLKKMIRNKENDIHLKIQELETDFEDMKDNISSSVGKIAIEIENKVMHHIKLNFIDREELNSCLNLKAQKEDVECLEMTKADRAVTNDNIVAMNLLFKQLELSVIITVECLKNLLPDPSRSENLLNTRYEFLFNQASTLLKWINLKNLDDESEDLLKKELGNTSYPLETESIVPSRGVEMINKENQNSEFDIASFSYPKKENRSSSYFKLDDRVKSKLKSFAREYTSNKKNRAQIKESHGRSLRTLFFNKSIMNKKHKMRESGENFNFKNKRSSHCNIRENISSLDRYNPMTNIPKLYDGCKTPVPSDPQINFHSSRHLMEYSKQEPCATLKVPSCLTRSRKCTKSISGTAKNIRIRDNKF
ncbi:unnamed protein product [Moneuplotes crassus]|uniref:Uncharacterized protein n=2 Tax=Euplotes crassus TaxID=5936 RepID=A0AAD1YAT6_EUPCR|nr:unnamed protein product [Moneuplotes crassus]